MYPEGSKKLLPILLALFAASGCSALIYEIVWYQLLQLVIGSTAISLGVLLATFMGGLCLGSLVLPRAGAGARACIRCGCMPRSNWASALCGILVLFGMPLVDYVYSGGGGSRHAGHSAARAGLRRSACCRRHC